MYRHHCAGDLVHVPANEFKNNRQFCLGNQNLTPFFSMRTCVVLSELLNDSGALSLVRKRQSQLPEKWI